jgi:RNA polymerase sigma-54 factor
VEALEPHGWLGRPVEEIARDASCNVSEAELVLAQLQDFEPPGLFARSLAECLQLQAREAGVLDQGFDALLGRLDVLAAGDLAKLAKICGCSAERVGAYVQMLRSFNPKPGAALGFDIQPVRPPDVLVSRDARGWVVELNASTLPEVVVRDDLVRDRDRRDAFVAEALATARGMRKAIEQRNANTLAVASEMVRRQSRFIERSAAALVPLSLRDVAKAIAVHESTVSRVTTGLTIQVPRGAMELRALLCRGLPGREAPVSVPSVLDRIRKMISSEQPDAPLSDERVATRLKGEGLVIHRRTVAKYRTLMCIPSSSQRRTQAPLPRG